MKTAEERKQYRRQQYLKHKDREKETRREYLIKNREKVLEKQRKYNKENPLKRKNAVLKNVYGITLVQYNEMFETQEGKCAICQRHQNELTRTLGVDHCHKTNKIRSLLCKNCNVALGYYEKYDTNKFEEYLKKHKEKLN
jgi:hypothetical protein